MEKTEPINKKPRKSFEKEMAMKTVRQQRILELIQMHDIEKQEELVQMLCEDGFDVTQATVSRDISQLRLKKFLEKWKTCL